MNKEKIIKILEMLVLLAIGLILDIYPSASLNVAVKLLGIGLLVYGLFSVISYFVRKSKEDRSVLSVIVGALAVIAGIVVLVRSDLVINFFPTVVGALTVVAAVVGVIQAVKSKRGQEANWATLLAVSLATAVLGVLMALNLFEANTIVRMLGVILIYVGAIGMTSGRAEKAR